MTTAAEVSEEAKKEKVREEIREEVLALLQLSLRKRKKLRSRVEDFLRKYLRVCLHPLGEKIAFTDYRRHFYVYGKKEDPKIFLTLTRLITCVVSAEFRLNGRKKGEAGDVSNNRKANSAS